MSYFFCNVSTYQLVRIQNIIIVEYLKFDLFALEGIFKFLGVNLFIY